MITPLYDRRADDGGLALMANHALLHRPDRGIHTPGLLEQFGNGKLRQITQA
jgi:hypothetical protein